MNLFSQEISLKSMNEILSNEFQRYDLIGDIPLSRDDFAQLATKIALFYDRDANQQVFILYKESLSTFLVFCAVYEYDDRTFWKPVEKYIGEVSIPHRNKMFSVFMQSLTKYNKKLFESESEEGYAHVTPILCHAGIPVNAYDSFFTAISNTVNDSFYDDFSLDDYNTYIKNKTEMTVKRYLKLCDRKSAYQFIQDTRSLIMGVVSQDIDQLGGNTMRMIEEVNTWREKPKVKKSLNARNNVRIAAPQIKIDADGIGVFCILPQIIINESYDSYVIWEIQSDDRLDLIKAAICRKERTLFSEEKEIVLRPASNYEISLKLEDNTISKWEYQGIHNKYLAFDKNGLIIKGDSVPNSVITLLLDKHEEMCDKDNFNVVELSSIPYWDGYSVIKIDLSKDRYLSCTSFNINITSDSKPVIEGGENLLLQSGSNVYVKLPYIKVPYILDGDWHTEIVKKLSDGSIISKANLLFSSDCERLYLSKMITENDYGYYQVKIWHHSGISGKYNIEYAPYSNQVGGEEFWPSEYHGYTNEIVTIRTDASTEIVPFNSEEVNQINHESYVLHRFRLKNNERYLIGDYIYSDGRSSYTTTIKKCIHPISWGIVGIDNEIVELKSIIYSFTVNELKEALNPTAYISLEFSQTHDVNTLFFVMKDRNNNEIMGESFAVKDKNSLRISLNRYLIEIQRQETIDFRFCIKLKDNADRIITSFLIARVQEEVIIEECLYNEIENEGFIEWKEKGTKINRECVLVNFTKPWQKPICKFIPDGECKLSICLSDMIYKYTIRKVQDQLFMSEESDEVCTLRDFQRGIIKVKGTEENQSSMQTYLAELLRTRFMKKDFALDKIKILDSNLDKVQSLFPIDVMPLSYAYIVIIRYYQQKEDNQEVIKLFNQLYEKFLIYNKDIMKLILDSSISNVYKKILIHKFGCNNLTSLKGINDIQKRLLLEIDDDASGFIYFTQNDPRGLNWAAISDYEILRKVDDNGKCKVTTFLTEANFGRIAYITQFYEFLYKSMQRPKNIDKSTEEFLKEFHNEYKVDETLIF
ncbi:MAG: hypothetical protein K0R92_2183, partial [Lachnospiraceae bacterium]|nr:hypothetical protein [Lachnospiraceae bacterium]